MLGEDFRRVSVKISPAYPRVTAIVMLSRATVSRKKVVTVTIYAVMINVSKKSEQVFLVKGLVTAQCVEYYVLTLFFVVNCSTNRGKGTEGRAV
jgi:hypothetical protein